MGTIRKVKQVEDIQLPIQIKKIKAAQPIISFKINESTPIANDMPPSYQKIGKTTVEKYFDKIFCINLNRRTDRWDICLSEFEKFNWTKFERFEAIDNKENGNRGCTASHRVLMKHIVENGWARTLVLEDDFKIVHDNFYEKFDEMIGLVPDDWDMLYLGGHYAEPPIKRINKHIIKHGRMFTTSSYGVTLNMAKKCHDEIEAHGLDAIGPIDSIYGALHPVYNCYIFQPRLIVQRMSFSDLQCRFMDNEPCMMDPNHENMV